ncbi:hypothetical protein GCM10027275_10280 [Rhabdobacter roseus]|uniref:Inosine/xanthosine triphosphate pyrophosphatase family protein n=1 Tax=Rhabdobacter roseus TaxID=1655419 RepID=A0A840TJ31_9BACT|nr:DUF2683 family protein [Rhabdobacter roseus]MBB5282935.1 inosine/xanthosine triphosphate pyrophosphatase family protein [Rhabdobacter roseus]
METLIIRSNNREKLEALKAVAKALKVSIISEEKPYDPEFVAKINESKKQFEGGEYEVIAVEDLWK